MVGGVVALMLAAHLWTPAESGRNSHPELDQLLNDHGLKAIRRISYDLCLPATQAEYVALGKNAIVRLEASSEVADELPLQSVYVLHNGVRFPLQRVAAWDKFEDPSTHRTVQISFYLLPLRLRKIDAAFEADFRGREGFVIGKFKAAEGAGPGTPGFVLRDTRDKPGRPDPNTLMTVLRREYPDDIR